MIDEEMLRRLEDFFEPGEFADYIGVSVREMIEAYPEKLLDRVLFELDELMQVRHG